MVRMKRSSFPYGVFQVIVFLALAFSFSLSSTVQVQASPEATSVSVSPSTQSVPVGDTFTVDIAVNPAEPIGGVSLDLCFDPSILSVVEVEEGDLGLPLWVKTVNNETGVVTLAGTTLEAATVSEPGSFAVITFESKASGTSALTIEKLEVGTYKDKTPILVFSLASNGEVTVQPGG